MNYPLNNEPSTLQLTDNDGYQPVDGVHADRSWQHCGHGVEQSDWFSDAIHPQTAVPPLHMKHHVRTHKVRKLEFY